MDDGQWGEVRRIFDAVCDLPPELQRTQVDALTVDSDTREEVLALLAAETRTVLGGRSALDQAIRLAAAPELQAGDQVGPWRLVRQIGEGGMGAVFLAERADELFDQQVAIKILRGLPDGLAVERLAGERRILAGLQHPGIARLYDGGTTPAGQPYLVMEYVDGRPLDAHCRERGLGLTARLQLFLRICEAVQAAHARLVVHCDLKPSNVLVRADDSPALLDFGIAHLLGEGGGAPPGFCTPAYAAPELQAGDPATIASDVFGLGMLLVELLAGGRVGVRTGAAAVPAPSALAGPDCPWRRHLRGDLDAIAAQACALAPADRYGSVAELAADVERHLHMQPVRVRSADRFYAAQRFVRRRWRELGLATAVLVLAAGFVWRLEAARAHAEHEAEIARQVSGFLVSMFEASDPRVRGARAADDIPVAEVLDRAAGRIEHELEAAPVVRARLQGVIGMAYRNMGDIRRALPLLAASAESLVAAGPEQLDEAAGILNMLAGSLASDRYGEQGEAMARRALELMGPDWPDSFRIAQSYNSLGLSLLSQQRYADAEAAFKQALWRHEEAGRDQFIAVSLDNLGMAYRRRGNLAAARQVFERSLPITEGLFGVMSYDYWAGFSEYALLLADEGRLEEAQRAFEENLARAPEIFGEHSAYFSSEHVRLGGVLLARGDYLGAEPVVARAVELSAEVMGTGSYAHTLALALRGALADARGDSGAAEADYLRVFEIRKEVIGASHPDTLDAMLVLGLSRLRAGREGAGLVRSAIAGWSALLPADSVNALRLAHVETEVLLLAGQLDAAAAVLRRVAADVARVGPRAALQHRVLQARLDSLGGDPDVALQAWQRAVDAAGALHGADSAATAVWRLPLADALQVVGDNDAAAGQRERARPVLQRQLLPESPLLARLP